MKSDYYENIFVCLLIISNSISLSQSITSKEYNLENVVIGYMNKIQKEENEFISSFIVYVMYAFKNNDQDSGFCVTIGHILNSDDYRDILPTHYCVIANKEILVRLNKNLKESEIQGLKLFKLDKIKKIEIVQKIYPSAIGRFTHISRGLVFCHNEKRNSRSDD